MRLKILLSTFILCLTTASTVLAGPLYVVVSNNLRGHTFTSSEIKRILLGEISMVGNSRIHLIYPSYTAPEIESLSEFVGKGRSVRNLKSYWSKMIFTGRGTPPLTANNESELKEMISKDNSIGVSTVNAGLNVVYTING